MIFIISHELKVGTNHTEGLIDDVTLLRLHHNLHAQSFTRLLAIILRYLTQIRDSKFLDIFLAAHFSVNHLLQVKQRQRNGQAQKKRYGQNLLGLRTGRFHTPHRRVHHTGIISGESLAQLVLLTFLQQVEVKFLLYLLLTLYAEQIFLLGRIASQTTGISRNRALLATDTLVEHGLFIVQTRQDSTADTAQFGIDILYQWVAFRRISHQVITLQHQAVIFLKLLLDGRITQTTVFRKQLIISSPLQMLFQVTNHVELVVQFRNGICSLGCLIHIDVGLSCIVHNQIFTSVRTDAVVHITQFRLNDLQTLIDEFTCADCYFIFVLHPCFTAHRNQGVQEIFSPLGIYIPIGHIDDGSLFVADVDP